MDNFSKLQTVGMAKDTVGSAVNAVGSMATAPFSAAKQGAGTLANAARSGVTKRNTTGTISADVDLFDILKGQLLDEGLTEQEVVEIMTTLTPEEIIVETGLSVDLLRRASIKAGDQRGMLAAKGDTKGAIKKVEQQKKFAGAMKQKSLETRTKEANRKPTQYDSPVTKPTPDPTKSYPGTPR